MKELNENWSEVKSALLTGVPVGKRGYVGQILENQKNQLITETATDGSVDTGAIAGFRKIMLPMIRRVIPNALGTEIVGVQPMQGPVGLVYSMRYTYKDLMTAAADPAGLGGFSGGNGIDPAVDSEAFGNFNAIRRFYSGATNAAQVAGAGSTSSAGANPVTGPAQGAGWPSALDAATVGTYGAAGPLYGGGSSWAEGTVGRKMGMEIVTQAVESKSRRLSASWTVEAMQDLQNQHGLDMENEMTKSMSTEIIQEIDNEILVDLLSLAGTVATYDGSLPATAGYYRPTFVGDRLANIGVQISQIANTIGQKTRKGPANFIVVSPMIVSALQAASKSVFAPAVEGSFKGPNNTMLVGTLNGSIKVYSYIWNQVRSTNIGGSGDDVILIGYKGGDGETDAGYFYCPYVPLMSSGVIVNPVTLQPTIGLLTRYGKAIFDKKETSLGNSADYYGKLIINDLSLL